MQKNLDYIKTKIEELYVANDIMQLSLLYSILKEKTYKEFIIKNNINFDFVLLKNRLGNFNSVKKEIKEKSSAKFVSDFDDYFNNKKHIPEIYEIRSYLAHPENNELKTNFIPKKTVDNFKKIITRWFKEIYKENININIVSKDIYFNNLKQISYTLSIGEINSSDVSFSTPALQRVISWDVERAIGFIESLSNFPNLELKSYRSGSDIKIFDGQHRVVVVFFLWYLLTGQKNNYKIDGKSIYPIDGNSNKRLNEIYNEIKSWIKKNKSNIDINLYRNKIVFSIEQYDETTFSKVFLFENTQNFVLPMSKWSEEITTWIVRNFPNKKESDIKQVYYWVSIFIGENEMMRYHTSEGVSYSFNTFKRNPELSLKDYLLMFILRMWNKKHGNINRKENEEHLSAFYKWLRLTKNQILEINNFMRFFNMKYQEFSNDIDLWNVEYLVKSLKHKKKFIYLQYAKDKFEYNETYKSEHNLSEDFTYWTVPRKIEDKTNRGWIHRHTYYDILYALPMYRGYDEWFSEKCFIYDMKVKHIKIPIKMISMNAEFEKNTNKIAIRRTDSKDDIFISFKGLKNHIDKIDFFRFSKRHKDAFSSTIKADELYELITSYSNYIYDVLLKEALDEN